LTADLAEKYVAGLKTPTLIAFGNKDRVINPDTAEVLHKLMPRSEVIIMPDVGHLPMLEQPRKSADDYLKFRTALDQAK
jgi:pimeloyl-ACP methyl ester carboxylesterase